MIPASAFSTCVSTLSPPSGRLARLAAATTGAVAFAITPAAAELRVPRVLDVPSHPAFIRPPGATELKARTGQVIAPLSQLRTEKPGRLQVLLADGRAFRLGGNALLQLDPDGLNLLGGQIIAWIQPGASRHRPLRIRTRVGTASIQGTTVFIEDQPEEVRFLSWEGTVEVTTSSGTVFSLSSGDILRATPDGWVGPRRLSAEEVRQRRQRSILLNGFEAPMETLPVIERELGLTP
ncbi:FecR family protein [Synechococcus sp. CS-1325]|uniref:FecR family protein n=1 Tax=unclassified Synechococcus TaxID=2626047 RepID=UPI000DB5DB0A|nr:MULTISPECIES: FecR family protein [unclassified Synechococcus]MCT0200096.1 FecR family protein [Synechococcus sp. CS-1325]MCT0212636.1 FecR family protein [Synechococcus sp. CS-1326]MCT0233645.1 FecR family protein [Synechococcus sp. CS-1327]PZV00583.1 MAG: iron dicitrate transport regulator FecR [Cyanobium sp.]